jgi:hypothetical protein
MFSSVVIANNSEFNASLMDGGFNSSQAALWHQAGVELADLALFWGGDDKLVITPEPLDETFVADVCEILQFSNVERRIPVKTGTTICEDILADPTLYSELKGVLAMGPTSPLLVWGPAPQLYYLHKALGQFGLTPPMPDVPPASEYWTARYLESKFGFREFCSRIRRSKPALRLPEGFVFADKDLATEAVTYFTEAGRGFVLKAGYGTAGFSTIMFPAARLNGGLEQIGREIKSRMRLDSFWNTAPVVLEEHICAHAGSAIISPTANFLVSASGKVTLLGTGSMLMRRGHLYAGVQSGVGTFDEGLEQVICELGLEVGHAVSALGYRGWFDVDFVAVPDGAVYLTEINARRTSLAHVFEFGNRLRGADWASVSGIFAKDHLALQGSVLPTYENIRLAFLSFNERNRILDARAVPTIVSSSLQRRDPYIGYAVIADSAPMAARLSNELEAEIWSRLGMRSA